MSFGISKLKEAAQARPSLHLSKCHIVGNHVTAHYVLLLKQDISTLENSVDPFVLFFTSQSTISQLCRDRSSWVEPVLSKD